MYNVIFTGVYIVQNTMARGGEWCQKKEKKNEAVRNKMKKKEKRGKEKEEKEKGEVFLLIYGSQFC